MHPTLIKEFRALRLRISVCSDPGSRWPRLIKEFHALRLPWVVGLAAGLAMLDHRLREYEVVAAVVSAALLAAMSMGDEFQHRTLSLLLSQPCSRRDLWREKLVVLGTLAGSLGLLLFLSWGFAEPPGYPHTGIAPDLYRAVAAVAEGQHRHEMVMTGIFFVAVVCSAPLWTLLARSILGGVVFSLTATCLPLLAVQLGVEKIFGPSFPNEVPDSTYAWAWLIVGGSYSGACLLAGRRKFARLELKDAILGESAILSTAAVREGWWWNWLRMRPTGSLRNLVRKELRLQKPVFVAAAVFSVCWLVVRGLHRLGPEHGYESLYEALKILLPVVYIPLVLAVAAAISLGEERTLGLAAWHLTLPVSARRQWLLKLAVGAAVAIGLGLVLPGLVGWATLPEFRAGLDQELQQGDQSALLKQLLADGTALWVFFVLSFWAATLLGNTVRAVSTALLGVGALVLCSFLSTWAARQTGGLETGLLCNIIGWLQLEPEFFNGGEAVIWGVVAGGLVLSLVALAQSLVQFRRAQVQRPAIVRGAGLLLAISLLAAFWCADFQETASHGYSQVFYQETTRAMRALPMGLPSRVQGNSFSEVSQAIRALRHAGTQPSGSSRMCVTEADLEKVYELSGCTKRWLKGASLFLVSLQAETREQLRQAIHPGREDWVWIEFPNGRGLAFPLPWLGFQPAAPFMDFRFNFLRKQWF